MSGYTHITIAPKIAALGLIIEPDSDFNITARKEVALATAAPDLLEALKGMLKLDDDIAGFSDDDLMQAIGSIDRNISQTAKTYLAARKAVRKATEI